MNSPKIPAIIIRIWRYKSFWIADVYDETKQFRGDCISYRRDEVDQFVTNWSDKAAEVTIEDTTLEPAAV